MHRLFAFVIVANLLGGAACAQAVSLPLQPRDTIHTKAVPSERPANTPSLTRETRQEIGAIENQRLETGKAIVTARINQEMTRLDSIKARAGAGLIDQAISTQITNDIAASQDFLQTQLAAIDNATTTDEIAAVIAQLKQYRLDRRTQQADRQQQLLSPAVQARIKKITATQTKLVDSITAVVAQLTAIGADTNGLKQQLSDINTTVTAIGAASPSNTAELRTHSNTLRSQFKQLRNQLQIISNDLQQS